MGIKIIHELLAGGFKYFLCSTLFGEMIQFNWYFLKWIETTNQDFMPFGCSHDSWAVSLKWFVGCYFFQMWISLRFIFGDPNMSFWATPKKPTNLLRPPKKKVDKKSTPTMFLRKKFGLQEEIGVLAFLSVFIIVVFIFLLTLGLWLIKQPPIRPYFWGEVRGPGGLVD